MKEIAIIKEKYVSISGEFNERSKRIWAASEANAIGHGGVTIVHKATNISRSTIHIGKKEILEGQSQTISRIRKQGGGRKSLESQNRDLIKELEAIAHENSIGNPEDPLRWTTKSLRNITNAIMAKGIKISYGKVRHLLKESGFSLQGTRKRFEGKGHVDRDAQFQYINSQTKVFQELGHPVVSVDAKKKELIGNFANKGTEYHKKGKAPEVNAYDFPSLADGKATPYGVYGIQQNKAWVNVGISKDTASFAVSTLNNWWYQMGKQQYKKSNKLLIHADGGGSNGHRNRLWKTELQKFANETQMEITVSHFPPGTSKWNKIEHRLFSQISKNWRGKPPETYQIIVNLIAATKTVTGLEVKAAIDPNIYETGIKISDQAMKEINIYRHEFHGENWNYTIKPNVLVNY
jgi:transposase